VGKESFEIKEDRKYPIDRVKQEAKPRGGQNVPKHLAKKRDVAKNLLVRRGTHRPRIEGREGVFILQREEGGRGLAKKIQPKWEEAQGEKNQTSCQGPIKFKKSEVSVTRRTQVECGVLDVKRKNGLISGGRDASKGSMTKGIYQKKPRDKENQYITERQEKNHEKEGPSIYKSKGKYDNKRHFSGNLGSRVAKGGHFRSIAFTDFKGVSQDKAEGQGQSYKKRGCLKGKKKKKMVKKGGRKHSEEDKRRKRKIVRAQKGGGKLSQHRERGGGRKYTKGKKRKTEAVRKKKN